jgi:anti-sigma B factor antagonist
MAANPKDIRDLTIAVERDAESHRVFLEGELDLKSASRLTSTVSRLCADGASHVEVDVANLDFIDSTGLHAILSSRAICEENHCDFSLTPAQDRTQVRRLLELTGLIRRLPFRRSSRAQKRAR